MRIIWLILIFHFTGCNSNKLEYYDTQYDENGEKAFYNILFTDLIGGIDFYSHRNFQIDHYGRINLPSPYSRDYYRIHISLYSQVIDVLRSEQLGIDTLDIVLSLDSAIIMSDSILNLKMPYTNYVKMLGIKSKLQEIRKSPFLNLVYSNNWDQLLYSLHDYVLKYKLDCSIYWYSEDKNTGSMISLENKQGELKIAHCGLVKATQDVIFTVYDLTGRKIKEDYYSSVDSIAFKADDSISVVKLTYPERFNFYEYIRINPVDDNILLNILKDQKKYSREEWLRLLSDMVFYNMLADKSAYNGSHYKSKRDLYSLRARFEYDPKREYTFENVKNILFIIDSVYAGTNRPRPVDLFDTIVNPPYKFNKDFMRFILGYDRGEKMIHPIEFFHLSRSIFRFRDRGWLYCWGCAREPDNLYFSLLKKEEENYIFYTNYLMIFNVIANAAGENDVSNTLKSIKFPLKQNFITLDGREFEMDSIYRKNLYSYSRN